MRRKTHRAVGGSTIRIVSSSSMISIFNPGGNSTMLFRCLVPLPGYIIKPKIFISKLEVGKDKKNTCIINFKVQEGGRARTVDHVVRLGYTEIEESFRTKIPSIVTGILRPNLPPGEVFEVGDVCFGFEFQSTMSTKDLSDAERIEDTNV